MNKTNEGLPELIGGLLRKGEKMLLTGPRFAGKSQLLIELAAAFAIGADWAGLRCTKSRAFYVNLQMDGTSCINRFQNVFEKKGLAPENDSGLSMWHLRDYAETMEALAPSLISMAKGLRSDVIILDQIEDVFSGSLRNEKDVAAFCAQLEKIIRETGAAVICCAADPKIYPANAGLQDYRIGSDVFGPEGDCFLHLSPQGSLGRLEGERKDGLPFAVDLCYAWPVHAVAAGKEA